MHTQAIPIQVPLYGLNQGSFKSTDHTFRHLQLANFRPENSKHLIKREKRENSCR